MKRIIHLLASVKVINNIKKLHPKWEVKNEIEKYYINKFKFCLYILLSGSILIFVVSVAKKGIIEEGKRIKRNDYGEGDRTVSVIANDNLVNFQIAERRYSENEIESMLPEFRNVLYETVKGDNKSFDYIDRDMNFVRRLDGYPFTIKYVSEKPLIISSEGKLDYEKIPDEGEEILITANISYYDYAEEISFYVSLHKMELSDEDRYREEFNELFDIENDRNKGDEYYYLPVSFNGQQINYSETGDNTGFALIVLLVTVIISVYVLKDRELEKKIKNREELIINEYSTLINKFTLLYSAGMPVKNIWMKVCYDYTEAVNRGAKGNPLYEEMIITKNQILNGKREIEAYEEFAERINLQKYRVFINLICQAVLVGRSDLAHSFRLECNDAYVERRNRAKKLYEEAGTKLMGPMFIMLTVVIIILMFPAFYSFRF